MSFDIYGNRLRPGHCEVHPHVHEEYPCSVCLAESANRRDPYDRHDICDGNPSRCESAHLLGQAQEEIDRLRMDAARYRHLRDCAGNYIMRRLMDECRPSEWDRMVDEDMAAAS